MYTIMEYVDNGHMLNPSIMAFDMNFEEFVKRMKEILEEKLYGEDKYKVEIVTDTSEKFEYVIRGGFLPVVGIMENEKLLIHKKVR